MSDVIGSVPLSFIFELKENGDGGVRKIAEYTLPPKKAMVNFIMQSRGNYNTWEYPETIKGIRQSDTVPDLWYFDDIANKRVLASYPF